MNFTKLIGKALLATLAVTSLSVSAGNVDVAAARSAAARFLQRNSSHMFMAAPTSAIKLSYTEASEVDGNAYYVFNIDGGGWMIIAGDDRAKAVLAYGTQGTFDVNHLPAPAQSYMNRFKNQIDFLKSYTGEVQPLRSAKNGVVVEPLLKTDWAQGYPFYLQCPMSGNQYCSVGCAGLAMAQILYYWKYPNECGVLDGYYNSATYTMLPSLPATTFDYDLIQDHYTIWINDTLRLLNTTEEQKQEVAKLCRYSSQSCEMGFTPDGSGSNVLKQYKGLLKMGYTTNAKLVGIEAWPTRETWNTWDYTDEEWVELINAQLEAKHPIPYSSEGADGHAFVIDGVDADGLYHVNWGWNGRCDGWFQFGAFNVTPKNETYYFNDGLFMVIDLEPYEGYVIPGTEPQVERGDVNGDGVVNIVDVSDLIDYLLSHDATGVDLNGADCDLNEVVDIADVSTLIDYLLKGQWN